MCRWIGLTLLSTVLVGLMGWRAVAARTETKALTDHRVFEMRTYHVAPGKMAELQKRFRDHTNRLLEKHGVKLIGFWTPYDPKDADTKLIWIIAHESKTSADASWQKFVNDPEWKQSFAASEKNGKLVEKIDRIFLNPTDFSPLK